MFGTTDSDRQQHSGAVATTSSESSTTGAANYPQPIKRRRTVGLRPKESTAVSVSPYHHGSTPGASSHSRSSGYNSLAETPSLRSTRSSGSFGGGPSPVGLPDFIIAIPPIPDFRDADESGIGIGGHGLSPRRSPRRSAENTHPTSCSLRAIRR